MSEQPKMCGNDKPGRRVRAPGAGRSAEVTQIPDHVETTHFARFMIDICDHDPERARAYVGQFAKQANDRTFALAVRREVERILAKTTVA